MVLDPESNTIEILPQPVILKPNAGVRISLRYCLIDQRPDRMEFMTDPCQHFPFTICVSNSELKRQRGTKQPYDK